MVNTSTSLVIPREIIEKMIESIENKEHVLLYGPPGTGKSTLAMLIEYLYTGKKWRFTCSPNTDEASLETVELRNNSTEYRETELTRRLQDSNVVVIDELDKMKMSNQSVLNPVLDNKPWTLPYSGRNVKTRAVVIAVANDINRVSEYLRDRFVKLEVNPAKWEGFLESVLLLKYAEVLENGVTAVSYGKTLKKEKYSDRAKAQKIFDVLEENTYSLVIEGRAVDFYEPDRDVLKRAKMEGAIDEVDYTILVNLANWYRNQKSISVRSIERILKTYYTMRVKNCADILEKLAGAFENEYGTRPIASNDFEEVKSAANSDEFGWLF